MNTEELLLKLIATQQGISEEAAAELLFTKSEEDGKLTVKEDALKTLLASDAKRVEDLKSVATDDKTKIYDKAFAEAKKDVLTKEEKALAEKYGIEGTNFKLHDLVETIVTKQTEGLKGDLNNEDAIKKSPTYLTLERAMKEEKEALEAAHAKEVEGIQANYSRTELVTDVKSRVLGYFDNLNPVLSKKNAAYQREDFANRFDKYNYERDGDKFLMLGEDGKRMEDKHGHPVYLEKFVSEEAGKLYDFAKQSPKGGAGNGGDGGGSGGNNFKVPTNEDEFNTAIFNATSDAEIDAITAAYEVTE